MSRSRLHASDVLLQRASAIDALKSLDRTKERLPLVLDPQAFSIVTKAIGQLPQDTQTKLHQKGLRICRAGKVQPEALYEFVVFTEGLLISDGKDQLRFSPLPPDKDPDDDDGRDDGDGDVQAMADAGTILFGIFVVVVIVAAVYVVWSLWHDPNAFAPKPGQQGWGGWFQYYIDNPHRAQPDFEDWIRDFTGSNRAVEALDTASTQGALREAFEEAARMAAKWGDNTIHGPNDPNGPIWVDTSSPAPAPSSPDDDAEPDKAPSDPAPPMA